MLLGQTKTFHILFNTIPTCPSQTGEGDGRMGDDWSEIAYA